MKIVLMTNIINPYATARFKAIVEQTGIELIVLLQASNEPNRKWDYKKFAGCNFKVVLLPGWHIHLGRKDSFSFHINRGIKKSLQEEQPDAVVCIGWNNPSTYFLARHCTKLQLPLLVWSGSTVNEPSLFRKLGASAIRWLHRRCSGFFAYGTAAQELLTGHWRVPQERVFVLGNPVDNRFFEKRARQIRSANPKTDNSIKLLFVGQLIERKGLLELLDAYRELAADFPELELLLAGSGPLEGELLERIENRSIPRVTFTGYVEHDRLPELYSRADIFCLPSREEVWGLVVNEAIASGLPVVVSDVCGAARDLIIDGETGFTFEAQNCGDLTEKLHRLVADPELRERITENGRKHIEAWGLERLVANFAAGIEFARQNNLSKK